MEYLSEIGTIVAIAVAILSYAKSGRKEQTELDKEQDAKIIDINTRLTVLYEKHHELAKKVASNEGKISAFDNKISKEIKEMETKLEGRIKEMKDSLTELINTLKR